jgi:hypothetical protein
MPILRALYLLSYRVLTDFVQETFTGTAFGKPDGLVSKFQCGPWSVAILDSYIVQLELTITVPEVCIFSLLSLIPIGSPATRGLEKDTHRYLD